MSNSSFLFAFMTMAMVACLVKQAAGQTIPASQCVTASWVFSSGQAAGLINSCPVDVYAQVAQLECDTQVPRDVLWYKLPAATEGSDQNIVPYPASDYCTHVTAVSAFSQPPASSECQLQALAHKNEPPKSSSSLLLFSNGCAQPLAIQIFTHTNAGSWNASWTTVDGFPAASSPGSNPNVFVVATFPNSTTFATAALLLK